MKNLSAIETVQYNSYLFPFGRVSTAFLLRDEDPCRQSGLLYSTDCAATAVSEHWRGALTDSKHSIYLFFCHLQDQKQIPDWLENISSLLFFFLDLPLRCYTHIQHLFLFLLHAFDPIITVCMPDPSWSIQNRERESERDIYILPHMKHDSSWQELLSRLMIQLSDQNQKWVSQCVLEHMRGCWQCISDLSLQSTVSDNIPKNPSLNRPWGRSLILVYSIIMVQFTIAYVCLHRSKFIFTEVVVSWKIKLYFCLLCIY